LRYDACLAFTDPGTPPGEFSRITLPAGDHAVLRHHGSYDGLEASNQRVIDGILALGRDPADFPLFHHFLDDPEEVAPEALRTDILIRLVPVNP
jgi:AraC family transcriptional regulator